MDYALNRLGATASTDRLMRCLAFFESGPDWGQRSNIASYNLSESISSRLPDSDVLFQILDNLRIDEGRRFWIVYPDADENICGEEAGLGQEGMEVKIAFPVYHNNLTRAEEYLWKKLDIGYQSNFVPKAAWADSSSF